MPDRVRIGRVLKLHLHLRTPLEIDSQGLPVPGRPPPPARQVFHGWMFASSPGLDLLQHPVYDAWLVACKTALPST